MCWLQPPDGCSTTSLCLTPSWPGRAPGAGRADRMLDMGFLPDIRAGAAAPPAEAADAVLQRYHAGPDRTLTREMLLTLSRSSSTVSPRRRWNHPCGPYPRPRSSSPALPSAAAAQRARCRRRWLHHRTKHRPTGLEPDYLARHGIKAERIPRRQPLTIQRTEAPGRLQEREVPGAGVPPISAGPRNRCRGSRGHGGELPTVPNGSRGLHSPGGADRAGQMTGDAFTLVSPDERELRGIERMVGKPPSAHNRSGLRYTRRSRYPFRGALAERIAPSGQKGGDRARSKAKEARRAAHGTPPPDGPPSARPASGAPEPSADGGSPALRGEND